jgi:hypothetical protein
MRSVRSLFVVASVAGIVFAISVLGPSAVAGATLQPLHITKECSEFTGETPSFCTITSSDLAAIPVGTKVIYWGPVINDPNFLSSRVVLRAGDGTKAFGYCQTIASPSPEHGTCVFWKGTHALKGFHASVDVTYVSGADYKWDGTYLFD